MAQRRQIIEIIAPTIGIKADAPSTILDPRSSPATGLDNANLYYGVVQKEYGTSLFITGSGSALGVPINNLFEAQFPNANVLQVFTHTSVYKYSSGGDTFVQDGQIFTGTYADYWSGVMHNDAFLYTNGEDEIQVKSAVGATGTAMQSAVAPTTYKAWALQSLRDHLVLYHVIENGGEHSKRVQWTKKGQLTYSAGTTDFASGTAGAIDVQDCEGDIKAAAQLQGGVAIYAARSIHAQFWVGGDEVFRFEKVVSGEGTPSRRGVVSFEDVNYVFGNDNIYAYHGGSDLRPIGDPVKQKIFAELNNSAASNIMMEFDPREKQVLCHIPTGSSELPNKTWVYRVKDDNWSVLERDYTAYGRSTRKTGLTWGEMVGDYDSQTITWGDASIRVEAVVRLYGDQSGRVVKVDSTKYTISNSGTDHAQLFYYQTPDLVGQSAVDPITRDRADYTTSYKRWVQCDVEMVGNGTAYAYYTLDGGLSLTEMGGSPVVVTPQPTIYNFYLDERAEQCGFVIQNTGTNEQIGIRYVKASFIPGGQLR